MSPSSRRSLIKMIAKKFKKTNPQDILESTEETKPRDQLTKFWKLEIGLLLI